MLNGNMHEFELVTKKARKPEQQGVNEMQAATKRLDELGVWYEVKSTSHLKIGYINYYPTRGTVCLDGQCRFKNKGLDFLVSVLRKEGILP